MSDSITIEEMQMGDISSAVDLWVKQAERSLGNEHILSHWKANTHDLSEFLQNRVKTQRAITAKSSGSIVGYLAYDEFPFNGEPSTFCPVPAHASVQENQEKIYQSLYKNIAQEWVDRNVFNHMWTINFNDSGLRETLFNLGFGSYTIDSFTDSSRNIVEAKVFGVRVAKNSDADLLLDIVEESSKYYKSSPIFLKRDPYTREDIQDFISSNNIFIALDNDSIVGFINISISEKNNLIELSPKGCGLIDELGIYIRESYRGRGLGKELLQSAIDYCRSNNIHDVHVDFETANLNASDFWPKYFKPTLLSLRRTINKDINQ